MFEFNWNIVHGRPIDRGLIAYYNRQLANLSGAYFQSIIGLPPVVSAKGPDTIHVYYSDLEQEQRLYGRDYGSTILPPLPKIPGVAYLRTDGLSNDPYTEVLLGNDSLANASIKGWDNTPKTFFTLEEDEEVIPVIQALDGGGQIWHLKEFGQRQIGAMSAALITATEGILQGTTGYRRAMMTAYYAELGLADSSINVNFRAGFNARSIQDRPGIVEVTYNGTYLKNHPRQLL